MLRLRWSTGFPPKHVAAAAAKSLQSCPTLCDPIAGSPPGKNTGVGCQFLLHQSMLAGPNVAKGETTKICGRLIQEILKSYTTGPVWCACSVAKSHLTLCDPKDCSPSGSSVHGILQARILEWVAMTSSRECSQPRDQPSSLVSPELAGKFFTIELLGSPNTAS